jgi:uncharacterized membrane protein (UPF0127 family)
MQRSPSLLVATFSWLVLGCACNRTEEPAAPSGTEPATAGAPAGGASLTPSTPTPVTPAPSEPVASAPTPSPACTVPFGAPAPVVGKATQCPKDPTGNLKLPLGKITFLDAPGAPQVEVELARDEASRERGLMYRTSMPESRGMLFSWQDERVRNFWMHNTCLPLDMLYVSKEGIIAGILEQVPTLNDAPRGIKCPVAHVLELNAGWARAHGLAPGMKLKIDG